MLLNLSALPFAIFLEKWFKSFKFLKNLCIVSFILGDFRRTICDNYFDKVNQQKKNQIEIKKAKKKFKKY